MSVEHRDWSSHGQACTIHVRGVVPVRGGSCADTAATIGRWGYDSANPSRSMTMIFKDALGAVRETLGRWF